MFLSSSTKEKIMNVRDYYEKRDELVDMNFMDEILTIIQKDDGFKGLLNYNLEGDKKFGPAYVRNESVHFNMNLFMNYIKRKAKYGFSEYPKKDIIKYYNLMALLTIFHECSHVWQAKGLEKYPEINRLHKDTLSNRTLRLKSLKDIINLLRLEINLNRMNYRDYMERQANIDALRELVEMYQDYEFLDFIERQHIYNLSFKPKGESLVHDTLKKVLLEYNYSCVDIPQDVLFEVGLPTGKIYSDSVYEAIDKYFSDELSYRKVIGKIKKH